MYELRITRAARRDVVAVMRWSLREFGEDAVLPYDALLTQALADIRDDPQRPGARQRPELAEGVFLYHLRFSRDRARSALGVARHPRHFLVCRQRDQRIGVLRVLPDDRELDRHLPEEDRAGPAKSG